MQENAAVDEPKMPRVAVANPDPTADEPCPAAGRDAARPLRVLLAEDDDEMRRLLAGSLRETGYEVTAVADGTELCRALAPQLIQPDADRYHVIVSDIRMPGTTGLQALEGLRALAELPPMILITAFGDAETHRKVRKLGAVILDKPFDIEALLSEVAAACSRRLRQPSSAKGADDEPRS